MTAEKIARKRQPDRFSDYRRCGGTDDAETWNQKKIKCQEADNKQKLGIAAGLLVAASSIAIIEPGDAERDIANLK